MNQFQVKQELTFWSPVLCLIALSVLVFYSADSVAAQGTARADKAKTSQQSQELVSLVPVSRSDEGWMDKHDKLVKLVKSSHPDIAFFGDSITQGMNVDLLHKIISPGAMNFGIGGDRTQHLLWRMRNGELDFSAPVPKLIVVLIGTNNISSWPGFPSNTDQEVYMGVQADVNEIRGRLPESKILLLSMLPRDEKPNTNTRKRVSTTNLLIKGLADNQHVWYADISPALLEADGTISPKVMSDFLHPTQDLGYERMFTAIKPYVDQLLGKTKAGH